MIKHILIFLCGLHALGFALFHMYFWKMFNWKESLKACTIRDRAIIQIINLRLIYMFLFVALLCFIFPNELLTSPLGHFFLGGMSLFWVGRTIEQFIFLPYNTLTVNILTGLFILGAVLFAVPLFLY